MTQLESCYFCGAVEEPLESYPVVPPEADPVEDTGRTVVVCRTCSAKLDRVLEPVVEHFASADHAGGDPGPTEGAGDDGGESPETGTIRFGAESEAEQETSGAPPGARREAAATGENEEPGETGDDGAVAAEGGKQAELPEETADIVRLIRNREFPVEREEIVTVAANAYEIRRGHCEKAIDALIAAGELTERDGELSPGR